MHAQTIFLLHKILDKLPLTADPNAVVSRHVEAVVILRDKKVGGHINAKLDVKKLVIQSSSTIYGQIKAYVKEEYGFAVSSFYIAQVKDKLGIKERQSYNQRKQRIAILHIARLEKKLQSWTLSNILK